MKTFTLDVASIGAVALVGVVMSSAPASATEATMRACQTKVRSTADNADCMQSELKAVEAKLPKAPNLAAWKQQRNIQCQRENSGNGSAGMGMELGCEINSTRVHLGMSPMKG